MSYINKWFAHPTLSLFTSSLVIHYESFEITALPAVTHSCLHGPVMTETVLLPSHM